MNILMSGINGYIGSYLSDYLIKAGVGVDGIARDKVRSCINKSAHIYVIDLLDIDNLNLHKKYDMFIHLAGANDIMSKDDDKALLDTTFATMKVLKFCLQNGINKFIYFSTFQVYGVSCGVVDEHSPLQLHNNYALTHFFAEEYIRMYSKKGLDYLILRPTNIYGAPMDSTIERWTLVPSCFCKSCFDEQKIELLSSGKQMRNFISLSEVSQSVIRFIEQFDFVCNKCINLASNLNLTIVEVARMVQDIYFSRFCRESDLQILNEIPLCFEQLSVKTLYGEIVTTDGNKMAIEIDKIFSLLDVKQ